MKPVWHHMAKSLIDFALPAGCLSCGNRTHEMNGICADCWRTMDFITDPLCASCGRPFELESAPDSLCAGCIRRPPLYDSARAVLSYSDGGRQLVLAFKHGDRTETADMMARWMVRSAGNILEKAECILPIPLHHRRLWKRRYNQSALLAKALSRHTAIPADMLSLKRIRHTPTQGGLSYHQRFDNVRSAFALDESRGDQISGKTLLLVDDVFTTGATVEAAARTLKKAGAKVVHVLTLARVVRPDQTSV